MVVCCVLYTLGQCHKNVHDFKSQKLTFILSAIRRSLVAINYDQILTLTCHLVKVTLPERVLSGLLRISSCGSGESSYNRYRKVQNCVSSSSAEQTLRSAPSTYVSSSSSHLPFLSQVYITACFLFMLISFWINDLLILEICSSF